MRIIGHLAVGAAIMCCSDAGAGPVPQTVDSITVTPSVLVLTAGQTLKVLAVVKTSAGDLIQGQTITWSSDKPEIVSVSSDGIITGIGLGSAVITGTAAGRSASVTAMVTPVPLRAITFDGYASSASMLADCVNWYCPDEALTSPNGRITLDDTVSAPTGGKTMQFMYNHPSDGCNTITLGRSFRLPSPQREVWAEFNTRFSTTFTTANDKCPPNALKFIFGDTEAPLNFRWSLDLGTDGPPFNTIEEERPFPSLGAEYLNLNNHGKAGELFSASLYDGKWHTFRMHIKTSSTSSTPDGIWEIWIDGVLKHREVNFIVDRKDGTNNPDRVEGFSFAHNKDDGPPNVTMYIWWGPVRVYTSNPAW